MPRDGSNIYSQPFPDVVEDTTIESTVYNGFTNDVSADLNAARPIVAGGTGAGSATDARFNLATEVATQIVTNYDDHLWVPGSFRSTSSATNPPVASHAFGGWCYIGEALANPPTNQNVVVHAFDFDALANTALLYTRQKKAGVWSDWNITTTEDNQAGARQAIYAAPFDALAYNGMQINGSMDVSQELGSTARTTNGYICDGWTLAVSGTMAVSASRTSTMIFAGFPSLILINVTTGATPGASDYTVTSHSIEGWRTARLAWGTASAQPITISFWSAHHRAGVYGGSIRNGTFNRVYAFNYTQSVGDVGQYNTITIPGDTSGTWATDNTIGMNITFAMADGSSLIAPSANTWTAGNYHTGPGQVNGVAATSDVFRITGVVILPGIEAPSAARSPLIMRPYDQELLTCQRYYNKVSAGWQGVAALNGYYSVLVHMPVLMRTTPVVTFLGNVTALTAFTTPFSELPQAYGFRATAQCNSAGQATFGALFSADARL